MTSTVRCPKKWFFLTPRLLGPTATRSSAPSPASNTPFKCWESGYCTV